MSADAKPPRVAGIEARIVQVRGHGVLLDADLASLYGVTTSQLNQQVRRDRERFPSDFVLELTWEEARSLLRVQLRT